MVYIFLMVFKILSCALFHLILPRIMWHRIGGITPNFLVCSTLLIQGLAQGPAQSRSSINIDWMNKWLILILRNVKYLAQGKLLKMFFHTLNLMKKCRFSRYFLNWTKRAFNWHLSGRSKMKFSIRLTVSKFLWNSQEKIPRKIIQKKHLSPQMSVYQTQTMWCSPLLMVWGDFLT